MVKKYDLKFIEYNKLVHKLASQIILSDIKFKGIYGIPRGGLPLAVHLSHLLKLPLVDKINKKNSKHILVVDEICDSGKTFIQLENKYKIKHTASLLIRWGTSFIPQFYSKTIYNKQWIVFHWEK